MTSGPCAHVTYSVMHMCFWACLYHKKGARKYEYFYYKLIKTKTAEKDATKYDWKVTIFPNKMLQFIYCESGQYETHLLGENNQFLIKDLISD